MNPRNPALRIAGPCFLIFKDKALFSKADVPINIREELVEVQSSAYGAVARIVKSTIMETTFAPTGQLDALAELYPAHLRNFIPGTLVHKTKTLGAINIGTDQITITAHGFRTAAMVRLATFGVIPAGLSEATLYFVHPVDANTITLHTTAAAATAGTGAVDITDVGTGVHRIIEQETLTIWSIAEEKGYIFANAAVTKMPGLKGSSSETALKEVTFTLYRKFGVAPSDAAAFYTTTNTPPTATFDPDAIIVAPYDYQWGGAAPWSSMSTANGIDIEFSESLTPIYDQVAGITTHRVDALGATATARPTNIHEDDVFAKRVLQNTGAGTGRRLSGDDLKMIGDSLYVILYNAVLTDSPVGYDGKEDRIRDLKWETTRKFVAGVPQPFFYIGAGAPA